MPKLPRPRGPITEALFAALHRPPRGPQPLTAPESAYPLADDDLQLALYCCYELHCRGFDDVDERWEWAPGLLAARAALEAPFEAALEEVAPPEPHEGDPVAMDLALREIVAAAEDGPSVARYVEAQVSQEQLLEFLVHRSGHQLKETDPHSWAVPRLRGAPKAALVELQADKYGARGRMHARLFADSMRAVGLDAGCGAYLDHLPAPTLATVNLMSLLGLHRRLRGAVAGHIALFEMTSAAPDRRYARGLRRLGFDTPEATRFFDEHAEADAVAAEDLAGGLARQEPALAGQILWGARALVALQRRWAEHVISAWEDDSCSLRHPVGASATRSRAAFG